MPLLVYIWSTIATADLHLAEPVAPQPPTMRSTIGLLAGNALLASAFAPGGRPVHLPGAAQGVLTDAAATAAFFVAGAERRDACVRSGVVCSGRSGVAQAAMLAESPIAVPGQMSKIERMRSRYGQVYEPEGGWSSTSAETDTGFSYADLEAGVGDIASFSRGDSVKGTVLGFEPNGALIDIGVKSSAYCAIAECALEKPVRPEDVLELGVEYEFLIVSREDENGQQMLSRRKVLTVKAWDLVTEMMAADTAVSGIVAAVNRGGAIIQVEGLRAFLPGSHYLPGQNPPDDLIGQPLKVKFLDVDRENNRLVVSHRKAMVDQTINDLAVGSVLAGVVTAVKPYGAFVDLGGMSGLLHISQISCDHIGDVGSVLPLGTPIKCMVISQDKSKGRVALSTKTLEAEPGDMLKNQVGAYGGVGDGCRLPAGQQCGCLHGWRGGTRAGCTELQSRTRGESVCGDARGGLAPELTRSCAVPAYLYDTPAQTAKDRTLPPSLKKKPGRPPRCSPLFPALNAPARAFSGRRRCSRRPRPLPPSTRRGWRPSARRGKRLRRTSSLAWSLSSPTRPGPPQMISSSRCSQTTSRWTTERQPPPGDVAPTKPAFTRGQWSTAGRRGRHTGALADTRRLAWAAASVERGDWRSLAARPPPREALGLPQVTPGPPEQLPQQGAHLRTRLPALGARDVCPCSTAARHRSRRISYEKLNLRQQRAAAFAFWLSVVPGVEVIRAGTSGRRCAPHCCACVHWRTPVCVFFRGASR